MKTYNKAVKNARLPLAGTFKKRRYASLFKSPLLKSLNVCFQQFKQAVLEFIECPLMADKSHYTVQDMRYNKC